MNTSSQARILICLIPDRASILCETLASFAVNSSDDNDEIFIASHRFIGISITPNITPPTKAIPI